MNLKMGYSGNVLTTAIPTHEGTMTDLQSQFDAAVAASKTLTKRPDQGTLLQLYSYYKQATQGDNNSKRPGLTAFVDRAKYDSWAKLKGTSRDDAMTAYIKLIDDLQAAEAAS